MEKITQLVPSQATSFFEEFKTFAFKGNLIDLAVGIVIGTAFNSIVNSLVNDIIMQAIAWAFGAPNFNSFVIGPIQIGNFITQVVNFLIIALSVFITLRFIMRIQPNKKAVL